MAAGDVTVNSKDVFGTLTMVRGTMEYGTAASGGIALASGSEKFGLSTVYSVLFEKTSGYEFAYDKVNDKVLAYQSAGSAAAMAEVTSGDLSAQVPSFVVFGRE